MSTQQPGSYAQILKFGEITEDAQGALVFQNFRVDVAYQYATAEEAILRLVIERFTNELNELEGVQI